MCVTGGSMSGFGSFMLGHMSCTACVHLHQMVYISLYIFRTIHEGYVFAACVCVCMWEGPASEDGHRGKDLNWNAGHRAAWRFRFCLRSALQVGNPSDTKCIPTKIQNTPPNRHQPPPRSKPVGLTGTGWTPGCLGRWSLPSERCGLRTFCPCAEGEKWRGHRGNWIDIWMRGHPLLVQVLWLTH